VDLAPSLRRWLGARPVVVVVVVVVVVQKESFDDTRDKSRGGGCPSTKYFSCVNGTTRPCGEAIG
jgi:hypothetical protein